MEQGPQPRAAEVLRASVGEGLRAPMSMGTSVSQRLVIVGAMALLALASFSAWRSMGRTFPSIFVDPFGDYSALQLSEWRTSDAPFRAGDRLVAIAGDSVEPTARSLDEGLRQARARGAADILLTFSHGSERPEATLMLRTIGVRELWWFFGLYALLGCSFLWSGLAVWRIAPRRPAAWVYVATTTNAFVFLVTFFDYHTTRLLTPAFAASSFGNALFLFGLAISFPSFPPWVIRSRRLLLGVACLGLLTMAVLAFCAAFSLDARPLRLLVNVAVPASLAVLAVSSGVRYFSRHARERVELRWVLFSLGAVPTWLSSAALIDQQFDVDLLHITLPLVGLLVPAGIGLSLIKTDFLSTGALLTRRLLMIPIGFTALALGVAAWVAAGAAGQLIATCFALTVIGLVGIAGWLGVTRTFFRSRELYQPLVTRFADRLAVLHQSASVSHDLAEVTRQLLPDCQVQVLDEAAAAALLRPATAGAFWNEQAQGRVLLVPLVSGSRTLGALSVSARPSGALFTSDELSLLETVASLAALALHNAQTVRQLEELRTWEASLSRDDKRLSVDILAAEVAHELAYPLNYFRHFLRRLARGTSLVREDVDIGQEEVARLERMLGSVRKLQTPTPTLQVIALRPIVERATALLRSEFEQRGQRLEVSLHTDTVRADGDQLLQVFSNLLRNASQAAGQAGALGITAALTEGRIELCVWDTGPGVPEDSKVRIFSPWFTTRPEGSGLGLAVTQRIVRSFGWTIDVERRETKTCFLIRGLTPERTLA